MKQLRMVLLRLALPALMFLLILIRPLPASAALGLSSVQPNQVENNTSTDLVISGSDFVSGAVVSLENYGDLSTTFASATTLHAMLPAGISPGIYTVKVTNPDGSSVALPNALTVITPQPTANPPDDASTPTPYLRPLVVVDSYSASEESISARSQFKLVVRLKNVGQRSATNIVATFPAGDLVPTDTGGVLAIGELGPGDRHKLEQPLSAGWEILGKLNVSQSVQVTYTDSNGTTYNETFNLTLPVTQARGPFATSTPTPTSTAVPSLRPQLVISGYATNVPVLQPGTLFNLDLTVNNMGNATAKRVTMILGGGSSSGGGSAGTPEAGGVSGGSGDFGNFAPVSASNVQFLGDLPTGSAFNAKAALIVNATANPGAYPMKISFTYLGENGNTFTDDQVITLLVYALPQLEVNFYRDPGALFATQPNQIPLQVVNLGKKSTVLGNMKVSGSGAQLSNNTTLVGALDPGGYFTLDAMAIPDQAGPLELVITIDYTDDFNQSQTITKTVTVDVLEAPVVEPGGEGGLPGPDVTPPPAPEPETLVQKVWRFVRGLIGLDSAQATPQPGGIPPGEIPPGEEQPGGKPVPVPVQPGKGG